MNVVVVVAAAAVVVVAVANIHLHFSRTSEHNTHCKWIIWCKCCVTYIKQQYKKAGVCWAHSVNLTFQPNCYAASQTYPTLLLTMVLQSFHYFLSPSTWLWPISTFALRQCSNSFGQQTYSSKLGSVRILFITEITFSIVSESLLTQKASTPM